VTTSALEQHRPGLPEILAEERHRRVSRRVLGWTLGLGLVAASVAAVLLLRQPPAAAGSGLRVESVVRGDVIHEVSATGRLEARGTVSVGPEISGRIVEVAVDFNDRVRRGQVLARFDTAGLRDQHAVARAGVSSARVSLHSAELTLEQATRDLHRVEPLYDQGMATAADRDAAADAVRQATEQVAGARARLTLEHANLSLAQTNLDHGEIRAPIDGVVITRSIDPGQAVAAALQSPELFVIAEDLAKMRVIADIDEADVGHIAVGQTARFTVDAFSGQSFAASLTELHTAPKVVQDVVTYEAVLTVENPEHHLLPGMTASVKIVTGEVHDALVVPNAALRFTPPGQAQAGHGVWVAVDGGPPRFVAVDAQVTDGTRSAVRGELQAGDRVIVGAEETP